jgi:hypothetical protein
LAPPTSTPCLSDHSESGDRIHAEHGGHLRQPDDRSRHFTFADGTTGTIADVWFQYDTHITRYAAPDELAPGVQDLLNLKRYGETKDLHDAMTEARPDSRGSSPA